MLEWGVRPTSAVPTNMTKGGTSTLPVEWEELYEPLSWQNTPMARNDELPDARRAFCARARPRRSIAGPLRDA